MCIRDRFAGVIANGRVFKGRNGRYVTFLTLGTSYGEYIDVTIQRPFAYRDGDVVSGQGVVKHSNNSDYIQSSSANIYSFPQWYSHVNDKYSN